MLPGRDGFAVCRTIRESGCAVPILMVTAFGDVDGDGRLDFTNNFMQRLADVFDVAAGTPREGAMGGLQAALFASATS